MVRGAERDPKEHDPNRCCKAPAKCQLAEILVERDDDAAILLGARQHRGIRAAGGILVNPRNVVSLLSKGGDYCARNVLVGEQADSDVHRERRGYTFSDCITALAYFKQA